MTPTTAAVQSVSESPSPILHNVVDGQLVETGELFLKINPVDGSTAFPIGPGVVVEGT